MKKRLWLMILSLVLWAGCGVRGNPIPPGTPAELGRGEPTYKRATEEFAVPKVSPVQRKRPSKKKKRTSD